MKVGRNTQCTCGSGLKFKRCCGKPKVAKLPTAPPPRGATVSLMGMGGEFQEIIACKHFREETDPRNTGGPAGLPGDYKVTFLFERPGYKETPEYNFSFLGPLKGSSHLAITRPAFKPPDIHADQIKIYAQTPFGKFEFTGFPNSAGFLGKVDSEPFSANNRTDAEQKAYGALLPALSSWSVHLDIPIHIAVVETTEMRTGNAGIRVNSPFVEAPFAVEGNPPEHDPEFAHYTGLYREALNSNSPVYRFLCLFKIIEGIRCRRARLGREAAKNGQPFRRPTEVIPENKGELVPWLSAIFPSAGRWDELTLEQIFIKDVRGKRIAHIVGNSLTNLRDTIAHGILKSGELSLSVDDLTQVQSVARWLPITRCIARRLLKNEFPKQFLAHLPEPSRT